MDHKKSYKKQQRQSTNARHNPPAVRAKKHLGQHFLKDETIAQKIADTLTHTHYGNVLEIGPGMGVLTKYILQHPTHLVAMDIDQESITYLQQHFPLEHHEVLNTKATLKVIKGNFLSFDLSLLFSGAPFAITGNFPYNISTQIVFKMLEHRERIPEFTGMFQKEVARRICASSGTKTYGILSVFVQAFYEAEYLFTVAPQVFDPPPKVESGVLRLKRKKIALLGDCPEKEFYALVKTAFGQRRKTLRNSLKTYELSEEMRVQHIFSKRPEQLSVTDFVALTQQICSASL